MFLFLQANYGCVAFMLEYASKHELLCVLVTSPVMCMCVCVCNKNGCTFPQSLYEQTTAVLRSMFAVVVLLFTAQAVVSLYVPLM